VGEIKLFCKELSIFPTSFIKPKAFSISELFK
jgi:hypothetical protein